MQCSLLLLLLRNVELPPASRSKYIPVLQILIKEPKNSATRTFPNVATAPAARLTFPFSSEGITDTITLIPPPIAKPSTKFDTTQCFMEWYIWPCGTGVPETLSRKTSPKFEMLEDDLRAPRLKKSTTVSDLSSKLIAQSGFAMQNFRNGNSCSFILVSYHLVLVA